MSETKLSKIESLKRQAEDAYLGIGPNFHPDWKTPKEQRQIVANSGTVTIGGKEIDVHGGIDRMTGLISMADAADQSGESLPHIVLRDGSSNIFSVFTPSQIRPVLNAIAENKNRVESAHNAIMDRYRKLEIIRDDSSNNVDKRLKAANDIVNILRDYGDHLTAEMKKYDPNLMPTDLPTLKEVLTGRLEAEANKNIKRIKNAVTQQGVDLPASCDDQENAIRELSAIKQLTQLNINALETAANVKAEYDKAVKKMADVTPLNTPIYSLPGNPTPLASPYAPSSAANRFTIRIRNPAGVEGIIETEITRTGNAAHKFDHIFLDTKFRFLLLTITPGTEASEFSVVSRNLCGPGKPFVIEVPAKS